MTGIVANCDTLIANEKTVFVMIKKQDQTQKPELPPILLSKL